MGREKREGGRVEGGEGEEGKGEGERGDGGEMEGRGRRRGDGKGRGQEVKQLDHLLIYCTCVQDAGTPNMSELLSAVASKMTSAVLGRLSQAG